MNVLEAASEVLDSAACPLRAEEITKRILELGLWPTKGKTPAATVEARICVDMRKHGAES
jgi:restriction system protein